MRWFAEWIRDARWRAPAAAALAGGCLLAHGPAAQADDAPRASGGGKAKVVITGPDGAVTAEEIEVDVSGAAGAGGTGNLNITVGVPEGAPTVAAGPYWLGIRCAEQEVDEALAKQADRAPGRGWFAASVVADSPAAQAGVREGDLLVAVDGKPLTEIAQLFEAVNKAGAEGKSVRLDVCQAGERKSLELKPTKRPERQWFGERNEGALREWVERWQQGLAPGGGPMGMMFVRPGLVVRTQSAAPPLPDDVTVKIEKTGQQPAKIEVRRGDQTWNVTEGQWDTLPAELRPAVAGLLGPVGGAVAAAVATGDGAGPPQITINGQPVGPQFVPPGFPGVPGQPFAVPLPAPPGLDPAARQQLEEVQRQLEAMQRQLDAIQRGGAAPGVDAKPAVPPKAEPEKKPARKPKPTSI